MKFFVRQTTNISTTVVIAMVFGFTAGVVGQIVSDVYIDPYDQDALVDNFNANTNAAIAIPELRPVKRFLGIEQDFQVNQAISKILPATVGLYEKKSASSGVLSSLYIPDDVVAQALILTSDGWLITSADNIAARPSGFVVAYGGQVFEIDDVVTDSVTGIHFLKIASGGLPVAVLGDSDEVSLGQLMVGLSAPAQATVGTIQSLDRNAVTSADLVFTSEEFGQLLRVEGDFSQSYVGGPLVNLGGEVVGIVSSVGDDAEVVPINQFRSVILDVLRSNLVQRPLLGVSYVDIAMAIGLPDSVLQNQHAGALVTSVPSSSSPADALDLRVNDIIVSVDSQPVDASNSLTELVQQYKPGDEVTFEILRDGELRRASAVLGLL